ncbi:hypothetical protein KBC79_00965 [Candidatus Woesebacteria bacterium]|nr:hypothetical protein [Candidatus Woesebacteria bacterium]
MYKVQRKLLSQNFLYNQKLVSRLVGSSSITKNDLVLEIGPGKGIISLELVKHAKHVIAVEIDRHFYKFLQTKVSANNFTLYHSDFLIHPLPNIPYKVFANIPFAIEGKIIRKLIESSNAPDDCYLVVMDKLAERLCAEKSENMFSVMHKPWFDFSIEHRFKPSDFSPIPSVIPVLFRFLKKQHPLLSLVEKQKYQRFIRLGYSNGLAVRQNLKREYGLKKIDRTFQNLSISARSKPRQISLNKWLALYKKLK